MKLKNQWILVLTLITLTFCGCKSNTSADAALPAPGEVDSNAITNEYPDDDKEKLLDMALKISGKKLTSEERNRALRMFSLNEKDVIQGLTVFLELSGGRYPSALDPNTTIVECDSLLKAKYDRGEINRKQAEQRGSDVFFAGVYYKRLVRLKKEPAYYGDKVTVEDSDKVLMRWKISDDQYRVVLGNLTRKSVTAEELAKLEKLTLE